VYVFVSITISTVIHLHIHVLTVHTCSLYRTGHGTGYNHPTRVSTGSRRPSMSASYLLDDNNGKIE
jgi:hypothetical protein